MAKVCIVGGAGFIGSHLAKRFVKEGWEVYISDNLSTGSLHNLKPHLVNGTMVFNSEIRYEVDLIYNLAALPSPKDYLKNPIESLRTCSEVTYEILSNNPRRFVLASTSEVYGNPERHPQCEDYTGNVDCIGLRSCYDEGKRYAEALTMAFYRTLGIDTRIARIFNTYGPNMRQNDGRLIPETINSLFENKPIIIHGDGEQTRSFCYVDDTVEALYLMGTKEDLVHTPINIGNPHTELSVNVVIDEIIEQMNITDHEIELKNIAKITPDDPVVRRPDISLAKQQLEWDPKIGFREGIRKTIEWWRKIH